VMNIDIWQVNVYLMTGEWFDVPEKFMGAAVCKLKKHIVIAKGFAMKNLEMQNEKCHNPHRWILNYIGLVSVICCGCGCYNFYRCKVLSRDREAHEVVLLKQQDFLLSNQQHQNAQVVHCAPSNQVFGQDGQPAYVPIPQYATLPPDSIQPNQNGNQGVSNAEPTPPAYNPKM